jgi:hypothetical protein
MSNSTVSGAERRTNENSFGRVKYLLQPVLCVALAGSGAAEPSRADLEIFAGCASAAQTRALAAEDARVCAETFLRIKLSFLPEVGPDRFRTLTPVERARTNRAGYLAYMHWRAASVGPARGPIAIAK